MADENTRPTVLGVAAATASLAGGAASGDLLSATAGFMEVVQHAADFLRRRQERIVRKLLEDAYFTSGSDSGAFSEFRALFTSGDLKSEDAKNVFVQTVRAAEAAVDEAVYPALAMLMRQYVREGRRYDGFFRSCSRLFQELSADEYASFAALIKRIAGARFDDAATVHVDTVVASAREEWTTVPEGAPTEGMYAILSSSSAFTSNSVTPSRSIAAVGCDPSHVERLSLLLDSGGLAQRYSRTRDTGMYLQIKAGIAKRIAAFVT
jgi:hypothetical protein